MADDHSAPADATGGTERDYRETVFLPQTPFPMRAGLPKLEPELLARWREADLYASIRAQRQAEGAPLFVLHDGPPYANGAIHIGHALNKLLKDFVVRSRFALGHDVDYVPGWDCHGLPIEWKIEEEVRKAGRTKRDVPVEEFRTRCREYAAHWIGEQSREFQRLGVLGDWAHRYATMDYASEATIVAEFHKVLMSGRLYRGSKPVMWSPVEGTALADAEVEYHDLNSPMIWVKFPVRSGGSEGPHADALRRAHVVIWTTSGPNPCSPPRASPPGRGWTPSTPPASSAPTPWPSSTRATASPCRCSPATMSPTTRARASCTPRPATGRRTTSSGWLPAAARSPRPWGRTGPTSPTCPCSAGCR